MTSLKSHVTLITILVSFERSHVVPQSRKVLLLGRNWFRNYDGEAFWPPENLMLKKPRLVRVEF